jgi:hypothetical protein
VKINPWPISELIPVPPCRAQNWSSVRTLASASDRFIAAAGGAAVPASTKATAATAANRPSVRIVPFIAVSSVRHCLGSVRDGQSAVPWAEPLPPILPAPAGEGILHRMQIPYVVLEEDVTGMVRLELGPRRS